MLAKWLHNNTGDFKDFTLLNFTVFALPLWEECMDGYRNGPFMRGRHCQVNWKTPDKGIHMYSTDIENWQQEKRWQCISICVQYDFVRLEMSFPIYFFYTFWAAEIDLWPELIDLWPDPIDLWPDLFRVLFQQPHGAALPLAKEPIHKDDGKRQQMWLVVKVLLRRSTKV